MEKLFPNYRSKEITDEHQYVALHISPELDAALTLFAIGMKQSRSNLIRNILVQWAEDKDHIQYIADKLLAVDKEGKYLTEFLIELAREELGEKKIPEEMIEEIIERFEECKDKAKGK